MDEENKPQNTGKAIAGTLMGIGLFLLELIKISLLAGVTIFLIRYYLFKPFYVKGQSMEPNFFDHGIWVSF